MEIDYAKKHQRDKLIETIRALSVALTNSLNELEIEHDLDMYDATMDYLKEKRP